MTGNQHVPEKRKIGIWLVIGILIGAAFGAGFALANIFALDPSAEKDKVDTEKWVSIDDYNDMKDMLDEMNATHNEALENLSRTTEEYYQLQNDKNTTDDELEAKLKELEAAMEMVNTTSNEKNYYWSKYNETMSDLTLIDATGRKVRISEPPTRIVTLASSVTETLYALDAGDLVVGRDKYSKYPEEVLDKPEVGSSYSLNVEKVVELDPDLIFCWWYATTAMESLESVGLTTFAINPKSLDDILQTIRVLGLIVNRTVKAEEVTAEMQNDIDSIIEITEDINKTSRPLVYYELSTPMKSTGPGTFTNELIFMAGGINLAADEPVRYPILNSEYIIERNPDIIVVVSYGASIDEIKERNGWNNITAVKDGNVYSIDTDLVTSNPRVTQGLDQFARWFHPDKFGS